MYLMYVHLMLLLLLLLHTKSEGIKQTLYLNLIKLDKQNFTFK
jgi:hypothetical protein